MSFAHLNESQGVILRIVPLLGNEEAAQARLEHNRTK